MKQFQFLKCFMDVFSRCFWAFVARLLYFPNLLRLYLTERRWYSRIDSTVILGALPLRKFITELVYDENIRCVISLNEKYELQYFTPSEEEWREHDVEWFGFSAVDFKGPSLDDIYKIIDIIRDFQKKGQSIYIHCKSGKGRSAIVVACYFIEQFDCTPEEAVDQLRSLRPHIHMNPCQFNVIRRFYMDRKVKEE